MLTLMLSAVSNSTARVPSTVACTLIMMFGPRHALPKVSSLGDSCPSIVCEAWRDFEADESVCAVAAVVDRPEHISGQLDVFHDQPFAIARPSRLRPVSKARCNAAS